MRWHQVIKPIDARVVKKTPSSKEPLKVVLLGFCCDEGVKRNQGRPGAASGPAAIRKSIASLPVHHVLEIYDAGDIHCQEGDLEAAQESLSQAVHRLIDAGFFPVVLGGGHEVTYGHFSGIAKAFPGEAIGVVNFDAHFDNRIPPEGKANSGTGFWQIQQISSVKKPVPTYAIGIQKESNTQELFLRAQESSTKYLLATDFKRSNWKAIEKSIQQFCREANRLYLTIDMDVFPSAYAPGVSAPNSRGILPGKLFDKCLKEFILSGKVVSVDFAELSPAWDPDFRTAKLTARLLFDLLDHLSSLHKAL